MNFDKVHNKRLHLDWFADPSLIPLQNPIHSSDKSPMHGSCVYIVFLTFFHVVPENSCSLHKKYILLHI